MLLDNHATPVPDAWQCVADDAALPADQPCIISLTRARRDADALRGRNAGLGVAIPPGTQAAEFADLLGIVALVVLDFPKFRDGRSFTTARALREHHGFTGEIRATGHVLPDQYLFLLRCGFSSVQVADSANAARWREALAQHSIAYQADVTGSNTVSLLRRHIAA